MLNSKGIVALLVLGTMGLAAPSGEVVKRAQTIYLAGDSTMARANEATTGWGVFLPYSVTVPVVNQAIGGRSSRSYTVEGRFTALAQLVQPNDIVILEFGHNDGGSLSPDNGRSVCPGAGAETCQSSVNNQPVTVHTFPYYLTAAGKLMIAKGAKVIVSSQTPNNPWEGGAFSYTDGARFVGYARQVASALGPDAEFVDHGAYTAAAWKALGKAKTDALFPQDHTHTSPAGAAVVARAFVKGVQCGGGRFLKGLVKNTTESIEGACL